MQLQSKSNAIQLLLLCGLIGSVFAAGQYGRPNGKYHTVGVDRRAQGTTRPIIGVLSLPLKDTYVNGSAVHAYNHHRVGYPPGINTVISAAYIKWLEQSGARVAVIPHEATFERLAELFSCM